MIRRFLCLIILLLAPSSRAATPRPATTRATVDQLAQEKAREAREYFLQIVDDPPLKLPTGSVSDIFTLTLEDNQLVVTPKLAPTDGPVRCTVNGITGPCV